MKKILSTAVFTIAMSLTGFSQDISYGKFLGSLTTTKFAGSSTYKGYEKQVEIIETTTSGQNRSTTISFKFNACPATANFMAHSQVGKQIEKGLITVLAKPDAQVGINHIKYQLYFESSAVVSCNDTQACNGNMASTVVLKPQRVCWIYYNYDKNGKPLPVTTNGFDLKSGQAWTPAIPVF
ncbi:MAG: hypothetical protein KA821_17820 [Chitinophagaceae bacterium]|nr:hypothetical protein [Chitinophagaceae bacterium]